MLVLKKKKSPHSKLDLGSYLFTCSIDCERGKGGGRRRYSVFFFNTRIMEGDDDI